MPNFVSHYHILEHIIEETKPKNVSTMHDSNPNLIKWNEDLIDHETLFLHRESIKDFDLTKPVKMKDLTSILSYNEEYTSAS